MLSRTRSHKFVKSSSEAAAAFSSVSPRVDVIALVIVSAGLSSSFLLLRFPLLRTLVHHSTRIYVGDFWGNFRRVFLGEQKKNKKIHADVFRVSSHLRPLSFLGGKGHAFKICALFLAPFYTTTFPKAFDVLAFGVLGLNDLAPPHFPRTILWVVSLNDGRRPRSQRSDVPLRRARAPRSIDRRRLPPVERERERTTWKDPRDLSRWGKGRDRHKRRRLFFF